MLGRSGVQDEAFTRARKKNGATGVGNSAAEDPMPQEDIMLQASLLRALGPQKKRIEEVDLAEAMRTAGLAHLFNPDQWPDSGAVRELASQMKQKKFVACDLHKFLPSFCPEGVRVVIDDESNIEIVPNVGSKVKPAKRLDLVLWQCWRCCPTVLQCNTIKSC